MPRPVKTWIAPNDTTQAPQRVQLRIVARQDGRCNHCGVRFTEVVKPQFDHMVALINGGANSEDNLQALCKPCHFVKTKGDVAEKAKVARRQKKALLEKRPGNWSYGKHSRFRKKLDGTVVDRETGEPVR